MTFFFLITYDGLTLMTIACIFPIVLANLEALFFQHNLVSSKRQCLAPQTILLQGLTNFHLHIRWS